jgi:predicted peptidase
MIRRRREKAAAFFFWTRTGGIEMLRKLIALTLTLTLLTGAALATEVAEAPVRVFVDARIVTKVLDEGQVVAGVRIEWDAPFTAGELTTASFVVNGYTIVALYVNEDGA